MKQKENKVVFLIFVSFVIGVIISMFLIDFTFIYNWNNVLGHNGLMYQKDCFMTNSTFDNMKIYVENFSYSDCLDIYENESYCERYPKESYFDNISYSNESNTFQDNPCSKPLDDWLKINYPYCTLGSDCDLKKFEYDKLYQQEIICQESLR